MDGVVMKKIAGMFFVVGIFMVFGGVGTIESSIDDKGLLMGGLAAFNGILVLLGAAKLYKY